MTPRLLIGTILIVPSTALAAAETLIDPTRPPPAWLTAQEGGATAAKAETQAASGAPVQLVISGPTRRFAIVRGELVGAGADAKAPRLVELKPDAVTIETKEGRETLGVFPGVSKTAPAPAQVPRANKEKK